MPKVNNPCKTFTCYELMMRCPKETNRFPLESFMRACTKCKRAKNEYPIDPDCNIYRKLVSSILPHGKKYEDIHWAEGEVGVLKGEPICSRFAKK